MTHYLPIAMLIISMVLLILSIFLFFYYGNNIGTSIMFMLAIFLGIVACVIFIYYRTPSQNLDKNVVTI